MKKLLLTTTALLGLVAAAAVASPFSDQVVSGLQSQGFDRIEIVEGTTQMKVEAIRGTTKVELIYDLATGALLKQETSTVDANDDTAPGVEIATEDGDFIETEGVNHDEDDIPEVGETEGEADEVDSDEGDENDEVTEADEAAEEDEAADEHEAVEEDEAVEDDDSAGEDADEDDHANDEATDEDEDEAESEDEANNDDA